MVVSRKDKHLLAGSLRSLKRCVNYAGLKAEYILIANGINLTIPLRLKSEAKILKLNKNVGFGQAVNQGMVKAKSAWVIVSCPDVQPLKECIKNLIQLTKKRNCGLIGPAVLLPDGKIQRTILPYPSIWQIFIEQSFLYKLLPSIVKSPLTFQNNYIDITEIPAVAAIFWLVNRIAFQKIGGFDRNFFLYFEDVDLCLRLRKLGYRIYYSNKGQVRHFPHQSTGGETAGDLYRRSLWAFLNKYYPYYYVLLCQIIFLAGCLVRIVYWTLKRFIAENEKLRSQYNLKILFLKNAISPQSSKVD